MVSTTLRFLINNIIFSLSKSWIKKGNLNLDNVRCWYWQDTMSNCQRTQNWGWGQWPPGLREVWFQVFKLRKKNGGPRKAKLQKEQFRLKYRLPLQTVKTMMMISASCSASEATVMATAICEVKLRLNYLVLVFKWWASFWVRTKYNQNHVSHSLYARLPTWGDDQYLMLSTSQEIKRNSTSFYNFKKLLMNLFANMPNTVSLSKSTLKHKVFTLPSSHHSVTDFSHFALNTTQQQK